VLYLAVQIVRIGRRIEAIIPPSSFINAIEREKASVEQERSSDLAGEDTKRRSYFQSRRIRLSLQQPFYNRKTFTNLRYRQPELGSKSKPWPRFQNVKAASQERYNRTQERNEKRRRSESVFALLELSKPTTIEDQTNTYVEESNCKACQADITAEYFTETLENAERLEKENASLKEQLKLNSICKDSFKRTKRRFCFILDCQIGPCYFVYLILFRI